MNKKLLCSLAVFTALAGSFTKARIMFFDFNEFFNQFENLHAQQQNPGMWLKNNHKVEEISKKGSDKYVYQLAIPGSGENDVTVSFNNKTRMILIEVKSHTESRTNTTNENGAEMQSYSSSSQSFSEMFKAEKDSKLEALSYHVENGLLTIIIPKTTTHTDSDWQKVTITKQEHKNKIEA